MSRPAAFLLGVVVGAALLHAATNYHVVRSRDGFDLIAKYPPRLSEAYVDIRAFSIGDWTSRPQLAAALVQADKQHLLGDSAAQAIQLGVEQLVPNWSNP